MKFPSDGSVSRGGSSNDHFLAQWGLFLGREGGAALQGSADKHGPTLCAPGNVDCNPHSLSDPTGAQGHPSPLSISCQKGGWQTKVTYSSDSCLVISLDLKLLPNFCFHLPPKIALSYLKWIFNVEFYKLRFLSFVLAGLGS